VQEKIGGISPQS